MAIFHFYQIIIFTNMIQIYLKINTNDLIFKSNPVVTDSGLQYL